MAQQPPCGTGGQGEEKEPKDLEKMTKPVGGFKSGRPVPPGKRMGHARAIISGRKGNLQAKVDASKDTGVAVAHKPDEHPR